jgi:hypothetical protein
MDATESTYHQTPFFGLEEDMKSDKCRKFENRSSFIGGSDARIIIGSAP